MSFSIMRGDTVRIGFDLKESEAVLIAVHNLKEDLKKTLDINVVEAGINSDIYIHTAGVGKEYDFPKEMYDESSALRKEAYSIKVCNSKNAGNFGDSALNDRAVLVISGSDRRGTVYGIYELSKMLGVSPWYYFADVPVKKRDSFTLDDDYEKTDYPTIEYRGFFINDEEELDHWVQKHLGEETIGLKAYEKIFELVLRLKANYMWPAMHVNSFNLNPENGALADRMGVVIGTSHCDMLMRSNNREWKPWKEKKGYDDAMYDYSVAGRNREILKEYWQESIEQNKDFEVSYTLGMRGVHDSGFEIRGLKDKSDEELKKAKVELLEEIINTQNDMLKNTLNYNPVKIFVPYKEVLPLYDYGLKVPEDFTLIWTNDNYGYVRRYPSENERKRVGGNGIYYHNSYWAPAGRSYVFLCSTPLAHTKNELSKAYNEGIRKLWVMNIGAIKPLEQEMTFFSELAWNIGKKDIDVDIFVRDFIDGMFLGGHGSKVAGLLNRFSQLANLRKLETLDNGIFSQNAYGDEFAAVINELKNIFDEANAVYETLQSEEKDAFFQIVLLRIHAVYYTYSQYYYADRSILCNKSGKMRSAAVYTEYSKKFEDLERKLIYYYNKIMSEGKWDRIVTPDEFPPPKAAMHPACMPPLFIGERKMSVVLWNDEKELNFARKAPKWLEISNDGEGEFEFEIDAPKWLDLSEKSGIVTYEKRIIINPDDFSEDKSGTVTVRNVTDNTAVSIDVHVETVAVRTETVGVNACGSVNSPIVGVEDSGILVVNAADAAELRDEKCEGAWRLIKRLGRGSGSLLEAEEADGIVTYQVYFTSAGEFLLELHRFPSLNSVGRIRVAVRVDDGEWNIVESPSNDEHKGTWGDNSLNNVEKLCFNMPYVENGLHNVSLKSVDKYFAISKLVVYTRERKQNNMAIFSGVCRYGDERLPYVPDFDALAKKLYGSIELKPRRVYYADKPYNNDTLQLTDTIVYPEKYAKPKPFSDILVAADGIFAEECEEGIKIDAVTAIIQTEFAFTSNGAWEYCDSESYGRGGLAVYVPEGVIKEGEPLPALNYMISCGNSGRYTVWVYMRSHHIRSSSCKAAVDGELISEERLYNNGKRIWRYEAEYIYRWVPLAVTDISAGKHLLTLYTTCAGVRFDRIYITKGNALPPEDTAW